VVVGGEAEGREGAVADQLGEPRPALGLAVIVDAVAVGKQPEGVGHRLELRPEAVGGAAGVPTDAAGRHPTHDHARLPGRSHGRAHPVELPQGQQIGHRATSHPDQIAASQTFLRVAGGLEEELQLGDVAPDRVERLIEHGVVADVVPTGREHQAHPGTGGSGEGQGVEQHLPDPHGLLHRTGDEAAGGGEDATDGHGPFLDDGRGVTDQLPASRPGTRGEPPGRPRTRHPRPPSCSGHNDDGSW